MVVGKDGEVPGKEAADELGRYGTSLLVKAMFDG
jgi:hypothetical protein